MKDLEQLGSLDANALERMVYLVGSARGGTSVSLHLIGEHPNLMGFHGPSHFINQIWRYRRVVHERLFKVIFWANALVEPERLFTTLNEDQVRIARSALNRAYSGRKFRDLHDLYPLLYALAPERNQPPSDIQAWFDKGNDANGLDLLAHHYPEAKFLFIVRDPRAAVATLSRVSDKNRDGADKLPMQTIVTESIYWRNLTQLCLSFAARHPDRSYVYAYERLVMNPQGMLAQIFDFLGLPPLSDAKLQKIVSGIGFGSVHGGTGKGLSPVPITRWRKTLSAEAVQIIAAVCGPTARKCGYDLATDNRHGFASLLAMVPGFRGKAEAFAKLAYLGVREWRLKAPPSGKPECPLLWSAGQAQALDRQSETSANHRD